jgi:hypothetical protein
MRLHRRASQYSPAHLCQRFKLARDCPHGLADQDLTNFSTGTRRRRAFALVLMSRLFIGIQKTVQLNDIILQYSSGGILTKIRFGALTSKLYKFSRLKTSKWNIQL